MAEYVTGGIGIILLVKSRYNFNSTNLVFSFNEKNCVGIA